MSFYRTKYLKSDHWRARRVALLVAKGNRCQLCLAEGDLDVHHMTYRNLGSEKDSELRVLCRKCHDGVHALLKLYPGLKQLAPWKQWGIMVRALRPKDVRPKQYVKPEGEFGICKEVLVQMRIVKRDRMKWDEYLSDHNLDWKKPILALAHYIRITGIDPRYKAYRTDHKLLSGGIQ